MSDERDDLFYSDLVYEIKKLARFEVIEDEETNKRIELRQKDIEEKVNGMTCYGLSDFEVELFEFIRGISKKAGVPFKSISEISKYPELVKEGLKKYENDVLAKTTGKPFIVSEEEGNKLIASKQSEETAIEIEKRAEEFKNNNLNKTRKLEKK